MKLSAIHALIVSCGCLVSSVGFAKKEDRFINCRVDLIARMSEQSREALVLSPKDGVKSILMDETYQNFTLKVPSLNVQYIAAYNGHGLTMRISYEQSNYDFNSTNYGLASFPFGKVLTLPGDVVKSWGFDRDEDLKVVRTEFNCDISNKAKYE